MSLRTHRPARAFLCATAFILLLAMTTRAASERIILDFQTAANAAAWEVVNDDFMGGSRASPASSQ